MYPRGLYKMSFEEKISFLETSQDTNKKDSVIHSLLQNQEDWIYSEHKLLLRLVSVYGSLLGYIPNQTKELVEAAVNNYPEAILFCNLQK